MRSRKLTLGRGAVALAFATIGLVAHPALAAEYWLKATTSTIALPGSDPVHMWGYVLCGTGPDAPAGWPGSCPALTTWTPGPALTVADTSLKVHLANGLSVPTSLVINGLIKPMTPVWTDSTSGARFANPNSPTPAELGKRVRSFDAEVQAGATGEYNWPNVPPGTYLYQSGTQPQVQVQMGLYGAVIKNATDVVTGPTPARGQAYAATATQSFEYDNQATLLYSEIDPDLHAAVWNGSYGTEPGPTSTFNYAPKYFLINGQPYPASALIISPAGNGLSPTGNPGTTLLRLLNAGLTTHVPMIQGTHWTLIAEDGKPYSYRRDQYTALLPAAKTLDLLLTPDPVAANYPIMDRRLGLSNAGMSNGGMLAVLRYGTGGSGGGEWSNGAPVAVNDSYDSIHRVTLSVAAPKGVLLNDSDPDNLPLPIKAVAASGSTPGGGTYTLNADGSFTYTPLGTFDGPTDTFTYRATDSQSQSNLATVTINLSTPAFVASANLDDFSRADPLPLPDLGANWSQQVGGTPAAPDIGINAGAQAAANSTALGGLALWNAPFDTKQGAGATLSAGAHLVLKATGPDPKAPVNYVRVGCDAGQVVVYTLMGGSNVPVFAKQASFGSCAAGSSLSAVVDAKGLVTAFVNGAFAGGVQLPDVAAWRGPGRIGIQMTSGTATADNFAGGTLAP